MNFFHDGCLGQFGVAHSRKEVAEFSNRQIDNLLARLVNQRLRRANDQFEITAGIAQLAPRIQDFRFLKHPLDRSLQQDGMFERCDLAVEPQMDACNWR